MNNCYWCGQEVSNNIDCPCLDWIKKNFPDVSNVIQQVIQEANS